MNDPLILDGPASVDLVAFYQESQTEVIAYSEESGSAIDGIGALSSSFWLFS